MKNLKKLFAILLAVILLAGCGMKESINLKINKDKTVGFEVKMLMDNEMIDTMISMGDGDYSGSSDKTYTDEERWKYLEENDMCEESSEYKCEKITEGDYKGFKMVLNTTGDIDTITGTGEKINLAEIDELSATSLFTKSGDVYSSNFEFVMDEDNEMSDYVDQMDMFKVTFEVTLPNASISNNADSVSSDGLTLTWNLASTTNKSIDFSFKFDPNAKTVTNTNDNTNKNDNLISGKGETTGTKSEEGMSTTTLILIIACSVLGLLVIILLIVLIAKTSKKKDVAPAIPQVEPAKEVENKTEEKAKEEPKTE